MKVLILVEMGLILGAHRPSKLRQASEEAAVDSGGMLRSMLSLFKVQWEKLILSQFWKLLR